MGFDFEHMKNGVLGNKHDELMKEIGVGINNFPITALAGAALHALSLALASIVKCSNMPGFVNSDSCQYRKIAEYIREVTLTELETMTISWDETARHLTVIHRKCRTLQLQETARFLPTFVRCRHCDFQQMRGQMLC